MAVYIDDSQDNSYLGNNELFKASLYDDVCKALKAKGISAFAVSKEELNTATGFSHALWLRSDGVYEKRGIGGGVYKELYVTAALAITKDSRPELLCQVSVSGDGMDGVGEYFNSTTTGQLLGTQPDLKKIYSEVFVCAATSLFSNK